MSLFRNVINSTRHQNQAAATRLARAPPFNEARALPPKPHEPLLPAIHNTATEGSQLRGLGFGLDRGMKRAEIAASENQITDLPAMLAGLSQVDILQLLKIACVYNSLDFVVAVMRERSGVAFWKDMNGQRVTHMACEAGSVEIVKMLWKTDKRMFSLFDNRGLFPFHVATINGKIQVLKFLLKVHRDSLQDLTHNSHKTALHLAIENKQVNAFKLLIEEALKRELYAIIEAEDSCGHNCIHIAVTQEQIEILKLLLVENPRGHPLAPINARNKKGLTALDLYFQNITQNNEEIHLLLEEAGAKRGGSYLSTSVPNNEMHSGNSSNRKFLLPFWALLAGVTFTSIFNVPKTEDGGIKVHRILDIVGHPALLPQHFYTLTVMAFVFYCSIVGLLATLSSIIKQLPACQQVLSLVSLGTLFLSYSFSLYDKVPKFWVIAADESSSKIGSFWFLCICVGLLSIPVILCAFVAYVCQIRKCSSNQRRACRVGGLLACC